MIDVLMSMCNEKKKLHKYSVTENMIRVECTRLNSNNNNNIIVVVNKNKTIL